MARTWVKTIHLPMFPWNNVQLVDYQQLQRDIVSLRVTKGFEDIRLSVGGMTLVSCGSGLASVVVGDEVDLMVLLKHIPHSKPWYHDVRLEYNSSVPLEAKVTYREFGQLESHEKVVFEVMEVTGVPPELLPQLRHPAIGLLLSTRDTVDRVVVHMDDVDLHVTGAELRGQCPLPVNDSCTFIDLAKRVNLSRFDHIDVEVFGPATYQLWYLHANYAAVKNGMMGICFL